MEDIFKGLNRRQAEAVKATEGRIVCTNKDCTSFEVKFDNGSMRTLWAGFLKQSDLPE